MTHRPKLLAGLTVAACLLVAGCGSSSGSSKSTSTTTGSSGSATSPTAAASALTGPLKVLAASSLSGAFGDDKAALAAPDPGLSLTFDFAGSQALVEQIQQGAPADVFASADNKNMQVLVKAGLVDTPVEFARNTLEIITAPGNPKHITSLADLAKPGVTVVLGDPSVPVGNYTAQILAKAKITIHAKSLELEDSAVVSAVTSGEADAAIVYVTDVTSAGNKVTGVPIPLAQNAIADYPIAVLKSSTHQAAAQAFVANLLNGAGAKALLARGFLPPS